MPRKGWTPSLAPKGGDPTVYLVVDDFGRNGRIFREADIEATDLDTVVADLLDGQYKNPLRVVALNTAEGWSQDARPRAAPPLRASNARRAVEHSRFCGAGRDRQLTLRLA